MACAESFPTSSSDSDASRARVHRAIQIRAAIVRTAEEAGVPTELGWPQFSDFANALAYELASLADPITGEVLDHLAVVSATLEVITTCADLDDELHQMAIQAQERLTLAAQRLRTATGLIGE